jgi:RNA ligase (TIGR02306 family)
MSAFECPVVRVSIETHPNADAIEIARVGGYMAIVKKDQFKDGDLAVYIPEQAVVPEWLLKSMGFWDTMNNKGLLHGSAGNRVKAIKLRGVLSQGLLLQGGQIDGVALFLSAPIDKSASEPVPDTETARMTKIDQGKCAAEFLGITKYEPAIPMHMQARVAGGDLEATISYDFENIKKSPGLFDEGMEVVITEKIHGTCLQVGIIPERIWAGKSWAEKCPDVGYGFKGIVTSKGVGAKGLVLDPSDETNLYASVVKRLNLWDALQFMRIEMLGHPADMPLFLFGEIFGSQQTEGGPKGIQDLTYGQKDIAFAAFDMYAGTRFNGFYLKEELLDRCLSALAIPRAPVLYKGPFSMEILQMHTDGNTTIGGVKQIREGVVVRASDASRHDKYGRRIAKSISAAYLLRKGEVTEFQ